MRQPSFISKVALRHGPVFASLGLFLFLLYYTAWLCDDAYISFRTVDNFIHGYGLTWNVGERVQAFTHPLWVLLLSAVYAVSREEFYTFMAFSAAMSLVVAVLYSWKIARSQAAAVLGLLAMCFSVGYVDYSTSGLENPLTHLLLAVFLWLYFTREDPSPLGLTLLASLAAVNRMDTLVLYLPALTHVFWRGRSWGRAWRMAIGMAPLALWTAFSLFYYGFPFPNTAYAKLNNGLPSGEFMAQGAYYLWHAVKFDPVAPAAILAASFIAWKYRRLPWMAAMLGVWLYLAYIVRIGGDFMAGRYLTAPLLASLCVLGSVPWQFSRRWTLAAGAVIILGIFSARPLSLGGPGMTPMQFYFGSKYREEHGICDERAYYYWGTGLRPALRRLDRPYPDFLWATEGRQSRILADAMDETITRYANNMGFMGFFAGPRVHIVDVLSLSDALLARIPPVPDPFWRIGHLPRPSPHGYLATIRSGKTYFQDPGLAEYYRHLATVTSGPLWRRERFAEIWNFNLGRYEGLLKNARATLPAQEEPPFQLLLEPLDGFDLLDQAVERSPDRARNYWWRALLYVKLEEYDAALCDLNNAVALEPDNPGILCSRAETLLALGDEIAGLGDARRALAIDPLHAKALKYVVDHALRHDKVPEAVALLDRAIESDPGNHKTLIERGVLLGAMGRWEDAWKDFRAAIRLLPTDPGLYDEIARTLCPTRELRTAYVVPPPDSSVLLPGERAKDLPAAILRLSRILATHPDARRRNAADATRLADWAETLRKTLPLR